MQLIKQKNMMWDGKLPALGDDTASPCTFTNRKHFTNPAPLK